MEAWGYVSIEVKGLYDDQEAWYPWCIDVHQDRWLRLYAEMAGVSNTYGCTPIAAERGFPDDVHVETKGFHWEELGKHETWLTPSEYAVAYERASEVVLDASLDARPWQVILALIMALELSYGAGRVRLIVSFNT